MKLPKQSILAALACILAWPALALEPTAIGWDDLAPEPVAYDNPFSALAPEQLNDLRKLLRLQQAEAADTAEAKALRAALETEGLDPDRLFEQRRIIMEKRREQATGTNDALLGKTVRMPGYLLPLELSEQKAVEFLLVPTVGACIHTPPPPPNQLVHVRYPPGFAVQGLYTPIWVTGPLRAESKSETVRYVDGEAIVEMSYVMRADTVEPYRAAGD